MIFGTPTPDNSLAENQYGIENESNESHTFGMAQLVEVNSTVIGTRSLNAETIFPFNRHIFAPSETLLLSVSNAYGCSYPGAIVLHNLSHISSIPFDENTTEQTVTYDPATKGFVPTE